MKNKLTKSNLIIAQRGVSLVAVFAVLVVSLLAVIPLSYGWFAKNNKVTASGMHTQAYNSKIGVTYSVLNEGTWSTPGSDVSGVFSKLTAPGTSVDICVTITNNSINKYAIDFTGFGLEAPTTEIPKVDSDGNLRYLSTELYTQLLSVSVTSGSATTSYDIVDDTTIDGTASAPVYLRGTSDEDAVMGTEAASVAPGAANRIDYLDAVKFGTGEAKKITVPVGGSVTFTIRVTFYDAPYNQNIYKDFDTLGECTRAFFYTYEDVLPKNNA